ncbi:MAG: sigma-70 family RNA polymerase sigma factor [Clostridia bacterium]|nr:sigma-70 family RNA polymerase sigma factor [Clostridia bacterium]
MPDLRTDAEVVAAVVAGDVEAFETLVHRYQRKIYNTVLRLSGDATEAEDLTQEVFLKLYRSLASFRGDSSFSTFVYRVASNTAVDWLRKRGPQPLSLTDEYEDGESMEHALPDPAPPPEERLLREEQRRALSQAIASLPDHQRLVLVLREVDGLSYQQIAEVTGIGEGTVKSRINRARKNLRKKLLEGNFFESLASKEGEQQKPPVNRPSEEGEAGKEARCI